MTTQDLDRFPLSVKENRLALRGEPSFEEKAAWHMQQLADARRYRKWLKDHPEAAQRIKNQEHIGPAIDGLHRAIARVLKWGGTKEQIAEIVASL